jgi:hypothetical protein
MITYNLNTEDVSNLIKAHLCDDLTITNMEDYSVISSDSDKSIRICTSLHYRWSL